MIELLILLAKLYLIGGAVTAMVVSVAEWVTGQTPKEPVIVIIGMWPKIWVLTIIHLYQGNGKQ